MNAASSSTAQSSGQINQPGFDLTRFARRTIVVATLLAILGRFTSGIAASMRVGSPEPLTMFGFTVIFPAVIVGLLLSMPPSRTREGVLMRIGTAIEMILVISVPPFALHLVLGLPLVFLLVELFETRLPAGLREPFVAWWVQNR